MGNSEFNTSSILDFNLAFGQGAEALMDFTPISLIVLWLPFFFSFFLPSTLENILSVPNLLRNEVTQGLGTSPGTNYQPPPPPATGRLVALTSWHPGLTSTELLQQPWQEQKKATRLHTSAQYWGGSEWGQIFHSIARGPSYGKFQSVKAKCYWNSAFLSLHGIFYY